MGEIAGLMYEVPGSDEMNSMKKTMPQRDATETGEIKFPEGILLFSKEDCLHCENNDYCLLFSGELYNMDEVARDLGPAYARSNPEIQLLDAYRRWGSDCLCHFNGAFSIAVWEKKRKRLFLGRDQMGLKPVFFNQTDFGFAFASQIKTILSAPGRKAALDRKGVMELLMLGPGRMPGSGIFRGIRELEPGCFLYYTHTELVITRYWKLTDGPHWDSLPDTAAYIRFLLMDAVTRQTEGEETLGTFLSGGLDSSILSALCMEKFSPLQTFSVDYRNNEKYFTAGKYQPDSDNAYVLEMKEYLGSIHRETVLTPEDLLNELEAATIARDLPGMGDVDFSLLAFCRKVKEFVPTVLSGECADEIFGGYPWFRDRAIRNRSGFPWAQNTEIRKKLLADESADAEDFVIACYEDTCRQADILPNCSAENRRIKEMANLNMRWFMQTLLERNDRMSNAAGLKVKVPFCDVRIAEYLYRIPWEMKDLNGREKGLLRYAVRGMIPDPVRLRKKSPYPKTFDPGYEKLVTGLLRKLLLEDGPLWYIVSRKTVLQLLETSGGEPWYGQLMRKPQFAAWLLQMDFWLKHYNIELCF